MTTSPLEMICQDRIVMAGADIHAQNGYHGNAMQAAASEGHDSTVKMLIEAGADVNAQVWKAVHCRLLLQLDTIRPRRLFRERKIDFDSVKQHQRAR